MEDSKLYVAMYDLHYPKIHRPTWNATLDFLSKNKVNGITFGGDQLDMESISQHTKGKGLYRLPGAYMNDIVGFNKDILTPLEALTKSAEKVWHVGNHERFEADLIEQQPELQGTVDHVKLLNLVQRGWKIIPLGHCSKIGKLTLAHGEILSNFGNGGNYPARKAVELYGTSVLVGHTHAPQSYTKISPVENVRKEVGWVAPCMCNINPSYLRNKPVAWVPGITIIETMSNGYFNLYTCLTQHGKFVYGGKVYGK